MPEQERGETQQAALNERYRLLDEKIQLLEKGKIITTDVAERFKIEKELEELKPQLREIESELNRDEKNSLIQKARRIERNKAYQEAIEVWEQIRQLDPQDESIDSEIQFS